jgi:hypothetical protein
MSARPSISPEVALDLFGVAISNPVYQTYRTLLQDKEFKKDDTINRNAFRDNINNIKLIKNPSTMMMKNALYSNPRIVIDMNVSHRISDEAIKIQPEIAEYVYLYSWTVARDICGKDGMKLRHFKERDEEVIYAAVKENGLALQFVKDPTIFICISAILQNEYAMAYVPESIRNDDEFKMALLEKYIWYWKQIPNTRDNRVRAVGINAEVILLFDDHPEEYEAYIDANTKVIRYIPTINDALVKFSLKLSEAIYYLRCRVDFVETEEITRLAIERNPDSIRFMPDASNELWELALSLNPNTLQYSRELPTHIQRIAIEQDPFVIEYSKPLTPEIMMIAVKLRPDVIKILHKIFYLDRSFDSELIPIYAEALSKDGMLLEFVRNQTHELQWIALKNNSKSIQFIKGSDTDMCEYAVEKLSSNLQFVKKQTLEMCKRAVSKNKSNLKFVNPSIIEDYLYCKKHALS